MTERKRLAIDLDEPSKKKKLSATPKAAPDEIDINGGVNPYTGRAYTEQFYTILEKRKQLPVLKFKPVSCVTRGAHSNDAICVRACVSVL